MNDENLINYYKDNLVPGERIVIDGENLVSWYNLNEYMYEKYEDTFVSELSDESAILWLAHRYPHIDVDNY